MVHVTIDGQALEVPNGTTVLNAAKMTGIDIPTLCHFEHLQPYGGCRLCVVEVEGARVLQPSCTLPVYEGMVVHTDTPKTEEARKFILTMLFSERNHFCMYCQVSGGDCELQNAAYAEGMTHWPIQPNWEPYPVDASHPYFVLDHNRCILCRRCIRACGELVGNYTLGTADRGAKTMVIADNDVPLGESSCIRCGTCVSVCPTGALIDRQSAFRGRIVDADQVKSICIGCSVGCGIEIVSRDNQLLKINGLWESPVNNGLLCEVGRFQPLNEKRQRILTPMVRKDGVLKAATWGEALATVSSQFRPLSGKNGTGIAAMASTRLPAEALSLFTELFQEKLQAEMVASVEEDFTSSEFFTKINSQIFTDLEGLKNADCVVVIGADLFNSHQVAGFFIKRNLIDRTTLIVIDPGDNKMDERALFSLKLKKGTDTTLLLGLMAAIHKLDLGRNKDEVLYDLTQYSPTYVSEITGIPEETILNASQAIGMAARPVFVYGKGMTGKQTSGEINPLQVLSDLAVTVGGKLISPRGKANSVVAAGLGLNKVFEPGTQKAVFVALGDDHVSQRQVQVLEEAPFLAIQASYASQLTAMADVVLPAEIWAEQEGTFINMEGKVQKTVRGVVPPEGVRSNVEILINLADMMGYELSGDWEKTLNSLLPANAQIS
jgi:formate dehydrogenase major subunit